MPLLSVLLPVKDGERTIEGAVRSTLRAMPRDSELLVVDDGSTDGTAAVLQRFTDHRLRVLQHATPLGVAGALNAALDATDSRLVARMDADDLCLPWRFAVQLAALRCADLVFGSMVLIDARGRPTGFSSPRAVHPRSAGLHLLVENPFAHPTMVGARSAITAAGGYRSTAVEDYDLWLRAVAGGARLRKLRTPVLAYRRHAGQATQSWSAATPDPLLDESYGAALPAHLRPLTSALRAAAVFRSPSAPGRAQLLEHLRQASSALPASQRRALLARARGASGRIHP